MERFEVDEEHGKSAAMIRNESMLSAGRPDLVVALSDDIRGDRAVFDLVARARARPLTVYVLERQRERRHIAPEGRQRTPWRATTRTG